MWSKSGAGPVFTIFQRPWGVEDHGFRKLFEFSTRPNSGMISSLCKANELEQVREKNKGTCHGFSFFFFSSAAMEQKVESKICRTFEHMNTDRLGAWVWWHTIERPAVGLVHFIDKERADSDAWPPMLLVNDPDICRAIGGAWNHWGSSPATNNVSLPCCGWGRGWRRRCRRCRRRRL